MSKKIDAMLKELEDSIRQAFMNGYKQGFKDGYDESYAEQLEQPQPKQSGIISVTVPVGYLCENAVGHKYFRWKKPSSTYKPIALYTHPLQRTWQRLTDMERQMTINKHEGVAWETAIAIEQQLKDKNV